MPVHPSINAAIKTLYSNAFRKELKHATNPYGNGNAAEKIFKTLKNEPIPKNLKKTCVLDAANTLAESLLHVVSGLKGVIQLAPCDAYLADAELFKSIDGIPLDDNGLRQPLLAKFNTDEVLINSTKISEVFKNINSCLGGIKARNINTQDELKEIEHLLMK